MYKQNKMAAANSSEQKAKAFLSHSMTNIPTYFFVDGATHQNTSSVPCNGYYVKTVKNDKCWKWVAPATPKPKESNANREKTLIKAYKDIASDNGESYEVVQDSKLKLDDFGQMKGPAKVLFRLKLIKGLPMVYLKPGRKNRMELYPDIFVGAGVDGAPHNKRDFVVFQELNHSLSKRSKFDKDLNMYVCEWDDDEGVGVKFEVANVDLAHVRPVIRDKQCTDKSKLGCQLRKVVVGVCPRLKVLDANADDLKNKGMKRENLAANGAFVTQFDNVPVEPYFRFTKADSVQEGCLNFKAQMLCKVLQEGWMINQYDEQSSKRTGLFSLPQTNNFRNSTWQPCSPGYRVPDHKGCQLLKPVCEILYDTMHLNLSVFVKAKNQGDKKWEIAPRLGFLAKKKTSKNEGNACVALIQDFSRDNTHKKLLDANTFSCASTISEDGELATVVFVYMIKGKQMKKTTFLKLEVKEYSKMDDKNKEEMEICRVQVLGLYLAKNDEHEIPLLRLDFDAAKDRTKPAVKAEYNDDDKTEKV